MGEALGLYLEGTLFKWHPYEDGSKELRTGANKLVVSRDGSLCATGDANGTIKISGTADFTMLYQLSSQDPVLHLSFSTDYRRLYDVRGTYGDVLEPDSLVRLADSSELTNHSSDAASDTESLARASLRPEHWFDKIDTVTALAAQPVGPLYCYGSEEGIAVLCEVGRGKIEELERSKSYMSIEQVSWSEDGRFVAIADLN